MAKKKTTKKAAPEPAPQAQQPGMMQPGMMQPGMMQSSMMQSSMLQPCMMQPGMMQPIMMQPVMNPMMMGMAPMNPMMMGMSMPDLGPKKSSKQLLREQIEADLKETARLAQKKGTLAPRMPTKLDRRVEELCERFGIEDVQDKTAKRLQDVMGSRQVA